MVNNQINVKVKKLFDDVVLPEYKHKGDAGMDVRAYLPTEGSVVLAPGEKKVIRTGLAFKLKEGTQMEIRPRSGIATKHLVIIPNSPGTLDDGYTGPLGICLTNLGTEDFTIEHGDRIAQLVFMPFFHANLQVVDELDETERGDGGFGSTGVK